MKNLQTFESFNDPNKNPVEKIQISHYITKTDFFSMKPKAEKDLIKKLLNMEFAVDKFKKDDKGDYVIETGDKEIKELTIPKKLIYEINKKSL